MKNLFITLVLCVAMGFISGFKSVSKNTLQIGSHEWKLSSAIIANESYGIKSKYELDLMSDNSNISKAKTFVWLSITSSATTKLADGVYQFSSTSLDNRTPFHFNGSVKVNGQEIKITSGSFSIENQEESATIHFVFKLENGDVANGIYSGQFSEVNRSSNYK